MGFSREGDYLRKNGSQGFEIKRSLKGGIYFRPHTSSKHEPPKFRFRHQAFEVSSNVADLQISPSELRPQNLRDCVDVRLSRDSLTDGYLTRAQNHLNFSD